MTTPQRNRGRHRLGAPGLFWCRDLAAVDAALSVPAIARRGLVERLLATARHSADALRRRTAVTA